MSPDSGGALGDAEGNKGTFGDDGNFLYLGYNDGNMDIYICQNSSCTLKMGVFDVGKLYLNKIDFTK